jgi:hypothetical protein
VSDDRADDRPDERIVFPRPTSDADLVELAREEMRRRADAPLPRSLVDFLR